MSAEDHPAGLANEVCAGVFALLVVIWEEMTAAQETKVDFLEEIASPLWAAGVTGEDRVAAIEQVAGDPSHPEHTIVLAMEAACAFACEAHFLLTQAHVEIDAVGAHVDTIWFKLSEARYWAGFVVCAHGSGKVEEEVRRSLARRGAAASHEGHRALREKVLAWYEKEGQAYPSKSAAALQASKNFGVSYRTVLENYLPKGVAIPRNE